MMDFEQALKKYNTRMSYGDRWLVWFEAYEEWIVYQRPFGARNNIVLYRGTRPELALRALVGDGS